MLIDSVGENNRFYYTQIMVVGLNEVINYLNLKWIKKMMIERWF